MEMLTRPFRYPNSVPVIRVPAAVFPSGIFPCGREGNLHADGVMIGNVRKTDRKTRRTLVLFFFFFDDEGSTRDNGGGGGGGGTFEDEVDDCSELMLVLGSPITGLSQPAMGEKFHEIKKED